MNAGIAANTAIECVVTGFPHDWQATMRPGPRLDFRTRLIAGRLQYGHFTIVVAQRLKKRPRKIRNADLRFGSGPGIGSK